MGGILGRADPVAWAAMADAMLKAVEYRRVSRFLNEARRQGNVRDSLALCRCQMSAENEARSAAEACRRLAGEEAAARSLKFAGVG